MTNKKCMLFETLGKVSDLQVQESKNPSEGVRLSGVFGVCGVKNQNNRIYDKANYAAMVESLQKVIATEGCPGELEHPNNFNINLENVSHKIESIEMNEDGTITGTILLLNTPKGKIAQAIVEGGLPLYISSRGAGTITNEGRVNLTALKTYDLVGTPGFSQAKLTLKENQTVESLNESLDDGNIMWAIVEGDDSGDDLLDIADDKSDDKKSDDKKDDKKSDDKKEEKKSEEKTEEPKEEKETKKDNKDNTDKVTMEELKKSIDKLADKVTTLEAQLHVAQESAQPNYAAIQTWIEEEFAPEFENKITEAISGKINENLKNYINGEFADHVQSWVCEEFAGEINSWVENDVKESFVDEAKQYVNEEFAGALQGWIVEEFGGQIDKWVTEEFAGTVENWITEEYSPTVENWIAEEYSNVVEGWINEEYAPVLENRVNENVSQYLAENNAARLDEIDSILETLADDKNSAVEEIVKETKAADKYANVYAVKNMPAEYVPSWNMIDENRKEEIVRSSKMYDFTKEGVLESFWGSVDFEKKEEPVKESKDIVADYHNNVFAQMMRLRH